MKDYERFIHQCDSAIREGRAKEVKKLLAKVNAARVPRPWRLGLAKICRRTGMYGVGLNLLSRLIHSKSEISATGAETAEYAVLLLRTGNVPEAITRLNKVNPSDAPEALLYRAYGHFIRWEYNLGVTELEAYMKAPLSADAMLVGRMNYALALIEIRNHARAIEILDENIRMAEEGHYKQVQSNCHTLKAQAFLQEGSFESARTELDYAYKLISHARTNDHLFLLKWDLILKGVKSGDVRHFNELRAVAVENRDWESLREADLYHLKIHFEKARFLHLFFGTPYQGFKDLIVKELAPAPTQEMYVLGSKSAPRFDLASGEIDGKPSPNSGKKVHQLIETLLRDFYQPLRIGGLFSALFANEYYDVESSPDRVRQVVHRARNWIQQEKLPVAIDERGGFYSLKITGDFSFRVPLLRPSIDLTQIQLNRISALFSDAPAFLARDVQKRLNLSKGSVHALIKCGIEGGRIRQMGDSPRTRTYKVIGNAA